MMISYQEAKVSIEKHLFEMDVEKISLKNVGNHILAQNICAISPSPLFDNSAMDGFAVCALDTKGASKDTPITLKNIDVSAAGTPSSVELKSGECIQCMTGAKIPEGADAIVMVEDSSGFINNDTVQIYKVTVPGKHIRRMGEEIKEGDLLIPKGTRISPSEIGAIATIGMAEVLVSQKPKIAIFGTGNELVEPGNSLKDGQIYNSNLFIFAELAEQAGAEILFSHVIKDDKDSLKEFLSKALETCDIIISSGGVSMGKYDYIREVFMDLGVSEHFWKVAQKPGKPLFFGTGHGTLIFGLPGNPVSSYIGFMEWVWPVLERLMGETKSKPIRGILTKPFPREKGKQRFLFGTAWIEEGQLLCKPAIKVGSHMLTSSLKSNCILSAEAGNQPLEIGDNIIVKILPWKSIK
ncbi:MAG: molybdopterin molybdotransferase MoeA [Fidelibacterota bacterium]